MYYKKIVLQVGHCLRLW